MRFQIGGDRPERRGWFGGGGAPRGGGGGRVLAKNLGISHEVIPIQPAFESVKHQLQPAFAGRPEDTTEENIQARLRGVILMALSNKFGSLLLTTGNKSELAVGYCTLYGDMWRGLGV